MTEGPLVPIAWIAAAHDWPRVRVHNWIARYDLRAACDVRTRRVLVDFADVMRTEAATRHERQRRRPRDRRRERV